MNSDEELAWLSVRRLAQLFRRFVVIPPAPTSRAASGASRGPC